MAHAIARMIFIYSRSFFHSLCVEEEKIESIERHFQSIQGRSIYIIATAKNEGRVPIPDTKTACTREGGHDDDFLD